MGFGVWESERRAAEPEPEPDADGMPVAFARRSSAREIFAVFPLLFSLGLVILHLC